MARLPRTAAIREAPRRWQALAVAAVLLLILSGCATVPFYEKGRLQDPIMVLAPDATEMHAYQKIYYSREGSVGGIGVNAGGGCGCY